MVAIYQNNMTAQNDKGIKWKLQAMQLGGSTLKVTSMGLGP